LAIDDGGGRTRVALAAFAAIHIERMMHSIQRTVETPQIQIIEKGAAWWKPWEIARDWHPVLKMYVISFTRTLTQRRLPPTLAGGILDLRAESGVS